MCVSKVISKNEMDEEELKKYSVMTMPSKFTKAKVKYMKLHDEMINRSVHTPNEKSKLEDDIADSTEINDDLLAMSTVYYRMFLQIFSKYQTMWQSSKMHKIIFSTSQPAHLIMVVVALFVTSVIMPTSEESRNTRYQKSTIMSFIYLASFVIHFGSQIWMTFVSGLSLYFALPRHAFGEVQRVLFPRYFTINAILSFTTLLTFVKYQPVKIWNSDILIQIGGMVLAFLIEVVIRLYFVSPLIGLMTHKIALERAAGVGNEIGRHNPGTLKDCPHYLRIHKTFRKFHMIIAIGNMIAMACTVSHLYYISSKLCKL